MAKLAECPVCHYVGDFSDFRAFNVRLAKEVKEDGSYLAPIENKALLICPKCGVAFKPE